MSDDAQEVNPWALVAVVAVLMLLAFSCQMGKDNYSYDYHDDGIDTMDPPSRYYDGR